MIYCIRRKLGTNYDEQQQRDNYYIDNTVVYVNIISITVVITKLDS